MRVFWAYAVSGLLHVATIAALAYWLPAMPAVEIRLRRGDSVVLSASFSQPAAPASETPTATIFPPEPIDPAPPTALDSPRPVSAPTAIAATPIEVERSEYEVDVTITPVDPPPEPQAATAPRHSKQSSPEPQPSELVTAEVQPLRRENQSTPLPVGEVSPAAPFQTATELGSEVDQLPSQFPNNRKPEYPTDALLAGIEGVVSLRVLIDSTGRVSRIRLERSSGAPSLDQSAISGVRQWRFSPARRGGLPVSYEVIVPVRFSIRS